MTNEQRAKALTTEALYEALKNDKQRRNQTSNFERISNTLGGKYK